MYRSLVLTKATDIPPADSNGAPKLHDYAKCERITLADVWERLLGG